MNRVISDVFPTKTTEIMKFNNIDYILLLAGYKINYIPTTLFTKKDKFKLAQGIAKIGGHFYILIMI